MKIVFQGDSITDGARLKNKALEWDKNHQIGHSYAYIITGLLGMLCPEDHFEFVNRGISGNAVSDLQARWQTDALDIAPDVLSVPVGVNDCIRECKKTAPDLSASVYEEGYRRILTMSREKNPALSIVILEPFAYVEQQQNAGESETIRRAILHSRQKAARRLAEEFGAIFVPLQSVFDEALTLRESSYWIWDGTYPTEAGHALIAREFLKATQTLFGVEIFFS